MPRTVGGVGFQGVSVLFPFLKFYDVVVSLTVWKIGVVELCFLSLLSALHVFKRPNVGACLSEERTLLVAKLVGLW